MKNRSPEKSKYGLVFLRLATLTGLCGLMLPVTAGANPYLAKPGEATANVHVATCAVSGGFIHLYTALDNGLFDK